LNPRRPLQEALLTKTVMLHWMLLLTLGLTGDLANGRGPGKYYLIETNGSNGKNVDYMEGDVRTPEMRGESEESEESEDLPRLTMTKSGI
jgi:hypothetical protein